MVNALNVFLFKVLCLKEIFQVGYLFFCNIISVGAVNKKVREEKQNQRNSAFGNENGERRAKKET